MLDLARQPQFWQCNVIGWHKFNFMIQAEAKDIKNQLLSDVLEIGITDSITKRKVAKLIAQKLKESTKDAVYQYVINQLNDELSYG